jgi:hypothetical protein
VSAVTRLHPKLNAYVTLDLDSARKQAEMKHKIVGRRGADSPLLRAAAAIEALAPGRTVCQWRNESMISELLQTAEVAESQYQSGLQVFGLQWPATPNLVYSTLDEAMSVRVVEIIDRPPMTDNRWESCDWMDALSSFLPLSRIVVPFPLVSK